MKTVSAIYEDGVFRPTQPVNLPERCRVEIDVHVQSETAEANGEPGKARASDRKFDPTAPAIEDVIADIMSKVPQEEWDSLPADLLDNLDHYLYGTPRK